MTNANNLIKLNNEKEVNNMNKENLEKFKKNVSQGIKTTGIMAKGILYFIVIAFAIWSALNFDVLVKAIRYPEAVRELKIEVRVSQLAK